MLVETRSNSSATGSNNLWPQTIFFMKKYIELFAEHTDKFLKELNSVGMLPFIGKEKALMKFVDFSNDISSLYQDGVEENNRKVLERLEELDKLYQEREEERSLTFVKLMSDMKSEMLKAAQVAFCRGVCKYGSESSFNKSCYCARRRRYLESLEADLTEYIEKNKESLTNKYKETSWKRES